jgi:hypothetical protein
MADSILQKPKSSGKTRMKPQFPGIGGHSEKKMDFMDLGRRLYDLVGVQLSDGKLKAGSEASGQAYIEGNKWGIGMWRNQANPFARNVNEPPSKLGFHLTRKL